MSSAFSRDIIISQERLGSSPTRPHKFIELFPVCLRWRNPSSLGYGFSIEADRGDEDVMYPLYSWHEIVNHDDSHDDMYPYGSDDDMYPYDSDDFETCSIM
jgi:hypothetical protein